MEKEAQILLFEITSKVSQLLEESEKRIDRTNKMVCSLSETSKRVSGVFCDSVAKMEESRDTILNELCRITQQNSDLIKLLSEERHRYSELLSQYEKIITALLPSDRLHISLDNIGNSK